MAEVTISGGSVLIRNLEIDNEELVEYLESFEDPTDGLKELIDIALTIRSRFSTDLETQNIQDAATNVIEQMDATLERLLKELKEKADLLVDPENGPIIRALDKATGDNLKKLLAPEDSYDQGPIARLRSMILQDVSNFKEEVDGTLGEIKSKLGIGVQKRKSGADGTDFEGKIDLIIQNYEPRPKGSPPRKVILRLHSILMTREKFPAKLFGNLKQTQNLKASRQRNPPKLLMTK